MVDFAEGRGSNTKGDERKGGASLLRTLTERALKTPTEKAAREAVSAVAIDLGKRVERDESSKDPRAWILRRVIIAKKFGTESVSYLLEPPEATKDETGISMVYVQNGKHVMSNGVDLLYGSVSQNPYDKYARTYTRNINLAFGDSARQLLEDIGRVYDDILNHGIRKESEDVTIERQAEGDFTPEFQKMVKELPFTGLRQPSSVDKLAQQYETAKVTVDTGNGHTLKYTQRYQPSLAERETENVIKPLPRKPLAECTVDDLDLTQYQLEGLLFRSTRYAERTFTGHDINNKIIYTFEVAPLTDGHRLSQEEIKAGVSVGEFEDYKKPDLVGKGYRTLTVKIPYLRDGSNRDFKQSVLPVINRKLEERGTTPIPVDRYRSNFVMDERDLEKYWSSNPHQPLRDHHYGDGNLINQYETLPGVLAKEVRDLKELGLEFDDIVKALEPNVVGLRNSTINFLSEPEVTDDTPLSTPFYCVKRSEGLPTVFQHISDEDPDINGQTLSWRYNVISLPFKNIESSSLDHRLSRVSQRGWQIPLSEVSFSLYKNRIVEGYYLPHYRISAARTVWALQVGTLKQQAKAFEIDWKNTTDTIIKAEVNRDRVTLNLMMNYLIDYFPRDDAYWKEHGFSGYEYGGRQYSSLRELLVDLKGRFEKIPLPQRTIMAGIKDID